MTSTILVVDDEEFLLEYVRTVLFRSGFTVLTAQTGEDAWHLILHCQNEIRLVLTDIVMPGSFDGFELADRVRRRQPDLPVLFMTGAPVDDHAPADALVSKRLLLRKPFDPEQLLAIVGENLEAAMRRARAKLKTEATVRAPDLFEVNSLPGCCVARAIRLPGTS